MTNEDIIVVLSDKIINKVFIQDYQAEGLKTLITFTDGKTLLVDEPYEYVESLLNPILKDKETSNALSKSSQGS